MTVPEVAGPFFLWHPSNPAHQASCWSPPVTCFRAVGADKVTCQITTAPIAACGWGTSGALPQPARLPSPRSQRQSAIGSGSGMLPASPERHWGKREVPHLAQDEAQRSASPVATESHSKAWRHLPDNRAGQRGPGTWSGIYK